MDRQTTAKRMLLRKMKIDLLNVQQTADQIATETVSTDPYLDEMVLYISKQLTPLVQMLDTVIVEQAVTRKNYPDRLTRKKTTRPATRKKAH